jgi:hypothetical protein
MSGSSLRSPHRTGRLHRSQGRCDGAAQFPGFDLNGPSGRPSPNVLPLQCEHLGLAHTQCKRNGPACGVVDVGRRPRMAPGLVEVEGGGDVALPLGGSTRVVTSRVIRPRCMATCRGPRHDRVEAQAAGGGVAGLQQGRAEVVGVEAVGAGPTGARDQLHPDDGQVALQSPLADLAGIDVWCASARAVGGGGGDGADRAGAAGVSGETTRRCGSAVPVGAILAECGLGSRTWSAVRCRSN